MTKTLKSSISSGIQLQKGLCQNTEHLVEELKATAKRVALITDSTVAELHANQLLSALQQGGLEASIFSFSPGESNKVRATKARLEDQMCEQGFARDSCILAVGGGVVTDMAGFIAATFCRGIPLVSIPTTLLGMVDASIGGKNGLNHPLAKNMIGSIYQPLKIYIDPDILKTLPVAELKNGIVEMIKHGLIADSSYFDFMTDHAAEILQQQDNVLQKSISWGINIKKEIVEDDERETGRRRLLNFGHTIGHAIEQVSKYAISHGKAVAIGILTESYMAMQLEMLPKASFEKIDACLHKYALHFEIPTFFTPALLTQAMTLDKKTIQRKPRFVMLEGIGKPYKCNGEFCMELDDKILNDSLKWMLDALRTH